MTHFFKKLSILTVISLLLASCVAKKEFDAVSLERNQLENDKTRLQEELKVAAEKTNRLEVQVEDLQGKNVALKNDLDILIKELKKVQDDYTRIKQLYDNLLTNSSQLSTDIAQQQQRLLAIEDELEIEQKRNQELAEDLSKREAKVAELERLIAEKDLAVQNLKKRVTDALLNFGENDLSVEVKNGKVYVSLAEKLLFNSGSTKVDEKGVGALKQLANALKGNNEINIMVEGHTDNVPLSGSGKFEDNWDLSVIRATSIVRILIDNGILNEVITASGRGEFSPVAENSTAENKALNRRTEIILTPKLDKLFQLLETY
ncbi:OmpA family protein [Roseivirga sp.]|uniref:OmpA family protein n=1 Tax=Roseivirga sp. TaxID=1964215 RepID=UPI003B8E3453